MALAAADFSLVKRRGLSAGVWEITGKYTGPASYASGGEILTNAIVKAALGINHIDYISFSPLVNTTGALGASLGFDYVSTASTQGKIHAFNSGTSAHTHDIKAIGGLTSSEPLFVDASQSFGKNAATNRTIVGSTSATTGGVVAAAAVVGGSEVPSTTDLSTYTSRFVVRGA